MTLEEVIDLAKREERLFDPIANWILENLDKVQPCGVSELIITTIPHEDPSSIRITEDWPGTYTPDEMRELCVMGLRIADQVDEINAIKSINND